MTDESLNAMGKSLGELINSLPKDRRRERRHLGRELSVIQRDLPAGQWLRWLDRVGFPRRTATQLVSEYLNPDRETQRLDRDMYRARVARGADPSSPDTYDGTLPAGKLAGTKHLDRLCKLVEADKQAVALLAANADKEWAARKEVAPDHPTPQTSDLQASPAPDPTPEQWEAMRAAAGQAAQWSPEQWAAATSAAGKVRSP